MRTIGRTKGQVIFLLASVIFAPGLSAQGTAFTYQGRLQSETNFATGSYDFVFSLWNASSGPSQVGSAVTNIGSGVTNGLFTAVVDFGGVFDGSQRWLQIAVRTNGGGDFTILIPRQPLTPTPYAIFADGANAAGISGTISAANIGAATITSNMLAPGAAAANLATGGQGIVPSGGLLLSSSDSDTNLTAAGYAKMGGYINAPNLWRERASALPARSGHAAVWTGSRMLILGGNSGNDNPNTPPPKVRYIDGGSYDPASDAWSLLSTNGAPSGRENFSTIWTGNEMIIWGGYFYDGSYHYFNDGARYNPQANTWVPMTTNGAPSARYRHTAVWTGSDMIVWGGSSSDGGGFSFNVFNNGWRYNPASNTWTQITSG